MSDVPQPSDWSPPSSDPFIESDTDGSGGSSSTAPDNDGGVSSPVPDPNPKEDSSTTTPVTSTSTYTPYTPPTTSRKTTVTRSRSTRSSSSTRQIDNGWVTSTRTTTTQTTIPLPESTANPQENANQSSLEVESELSSSTSPSPPGTETETQILEPEDAPSSASSITSPIDRVPASDSVNDATSQPSTSKARLPVSDREPVAPVPSSLDNEVSSLEGGDSTETGLDGSAKAGIVIGVLIAVCAILLAIHFLRKRVIAERRRKYLKHHSNMFGHQRKPSDFSEFDKVDQLSTVTGEKNHTNERGSFAPSFNLAGRGLPPQFDLLGPVSAPGDDIGSDWPAWMGHMGAARPPSVNSTATSATNLGRRDLRISVIAPSPVSSRNGPFHQQGSHSRASSTLSGNHLHPIHAQVKFSQRAASTRSRESLATVNDSSGEPSPIFSHITDRFPLPTSSARSVSDETTVASSSPALDTKGRPFASNNPFRNSVALPSSPLQRRYSPMSDDGGANPFELELERASLDIDFTKVGLTPVSSGHNTVNPTTPITPRPRRKSASSLSLYSEDGGHFRSGNGNNPFDVDSTPIASTRHTRAVPARDSITEALDLATVNRANTWSVLDSYSADSSRRPSYTSEKSGPDPSAWADELADESSHTPKTFSKILDMYAGRAM